MYSYDRQVTSQQAGSRRQIVDLIVKQIFKDRDAKDLMEAWISDAIDDWSDDHEEVIPSDPREYDKWLEQEIGVLLETTEIEKALQAAYVDVYRRLVHGASSAQALEVLDYPRGVPDTRVPKEVAVAIGKAMAARDAADSIALLEAAKERYGQ